MTKTILGRPDLGRYTTPNHIAFHKLGFGICEKYASAIGAQTLIDNYGAAVNKESEIFKWIRRSEYTEKKVKADQKRDNLYLGITGTARVNLRHFDPQVQDAAVHVDNLLTGYGDVTRMGYDAETVAIDSLIARLRNADYTAAVQLLGLSTWIDNLETANNEFKEYVDDATQEEIDRPDITPKVARRQSDGALRPITDRVEALITLNGEATFADFIAEYDTLVKHYNTLTHEHYGRLHAQIDIAPAELAPIAPQAFAGRPVFVIPEVTLRTVAADGTESITQLVFSRDFTVAYKNNTQPGTATLTIQGIGKYKGEVVTTFNIIMN
ncbi:MAG: DUF6261 family protein [Prevotellaceae bacterium]|jgi:hypothetical protein|nr:DUF6261 family protein [Prevotellaceae bacterium]